jgi:hypothetical protein
MQIPQPGNVVHDSGVEFMGCKLQEMLESYGIKSKPMTVKNPTANAIVKCIHGMLVSTNWSNDIDMLIQACAFALGAASPA